MLFGSCQNHQPFARQRCRNLTKIEREGVCVCVCVKIEREKGCVCVCVCEDIEREGVCVCVCVYLFFCR